VAAFLSEHKRVKKVYYPGLPAHPGQAVAKRQMSDFGGMLSFVLDGSVEEGKRFTTRTKIFALAESLGGVESLIEHPPSMTPRLDPGRAAPRGGPRRRPHPPLGGRRGSRRPDRGPRAGVRVG
jgi:cystathionine beta-lyase/cystathionine gamma-synthase